jgi:hypothetical protein
MLVGRWSTLGGVRTECEPGDDIYVDRYKSFEVGAILPGGPDTDPTLVETVRLEARPLVLSSYPRQSIVPVPQQKEKYQSLKALRLLLLLIGGILAGPALEPS